MKESYKKTVTLTPKEVKDLFLKSFSYLTQDLLENDTFKSFVLKSIVEKYGGSPEDYHYHVLTHPAYQRPTILSDLEPVIEVVTPRSYSQSDVETSLTSKIVYKYYVNGLPLDKDLIDTFDEIVANTGDGKVYNPDMQWFIVFFTERNLWYPIQRRTVQYILSNYNLDDNAKALLQSEIDRWDVEEIWRSESPRF